MPTTLKNSLTIIGGTGVTASNSGVSFDGSFPAINQQISIGQNIDTTDNVQFNAVTSSGYDLSGYTLLADRWTTDFSAGGNLKVTGNLIIPGNASVGVNVTAEKITSELTSSGTIFQSGSTAFGDTIDDIHYFSGSIYQSGSFSLLGYNVNEISNDTSLTDNSSTAIVTEGAFKTYADANVGTTIVEPYLRKNFNKTALSVSNNTASFYAFSASAPDGIAATNENDFLFFNNGQIMEHDALTIQQSGSNLLLKVDSDSIGYNLESDDDIKAWGRFEPPMTYLEFDGLTNEVTTNFSGSARVSMSASPNKTYSWWMKSTETARNYAVFGYGNQKVEAFTPNFSNGRPLIWNGNSWFVYWDAAPVDHAWDGGWHHWMCYNDVMAITGSKLYVDGTLISVNLYKTTGTVDNLFDQLQPLTIGSFQNNSTNLGRHLEGSLMEFSVFSGDKTGNASTYYNNGTPYDVTNEDNLQAYWKMDEYSGSIANDSSGEGNHGTIDGATWRNT